jgi:hypothetical protein
MQARLPPRRSAGGAPLTARRHTPGGHARDASGKMSARSKTGDGSLGVTPRRHNSSKVQRADRARPAHDMCGFLFLC